MDIRLDEVVSQAYISGGQSQAGKRGRRCRSMRLRI
jgi:hypothetical protein